MVPHSLRFNWTVNWLTECCCHCSGFHKAHCKRLETIQHRPHSSRLFSGMFLVSGCITNREGITQQYDEMNAFNAVSYSAPLYMLSEVLLYYLLKNILIGNRFFLQFNNALLSETSGVTDEIKMWNLWKVIFKFVSNFSTLTKNLDYIERFQYIQKVVVTYFLANGRQEQNSSRQIV